MKHILENSIDRPGQITSEITDLADVNARVYGNRAVFTDHAMVRSRFNGQDFSDFYQLIRGLREAAGTLASDRVNNGAHRRQNETGREQLS